MKGFILPGQRLFDLTVKDTIAIMMFDLNYKVGLFMIGLTTYEIFLPFN